MRIEDVAKIQDPFDRLMYWIIERERVRLSKERNAGKPWTEDFILQSYRFCNVRRMDDKVSKWLMENWYKPNLNHTNALIACALARFFNLPSTLEHIGFPLLWDPTVYKYVLKKRRDLVHVLFNGAYMVRGNDGEDKIDSVIDFYVDPLVRNGIANQLDYSSMERSVDILQESYGFGSFMAGQVIADMRWIVTQRAEVVDKTTFMEHLKPIKFFYNTDLWQDRNTWAAQGPGSTRGLNRVLGRDPKFPVSREMFQKEFGQLRTRVMESLAENKTYPVLCERLLMELEAHDYQNCLCEYDKYERVLWGAGRPKQRYSGSGL